MRRVGVSQAGLPRTIPFALCVRAGCFVIQDLRSGFGALVQDACHGLIQSRQLERLIEVRVSAVQR
jgi:hypothetical protein